MLKINETLNCNGQLLDVSLPKIMGILNVTPDSFYDGGYYQSEKSIVKQAAKLLEEGADIIDVGGMSSRPGAEIIPIREELQRVIPTIEAIKRNFAQSIISIDTVQSEVAKAAVESGASIVNDISGGSIDANLLPTVAQLNVPYILMHMQGKPENMQTKPKYDDVVLEIVDFFSQKIGILQELGIKDVIIDVGFGFGKTLAQNYQLLNNLASFKILSCPILVGASRKSMIYKLLNTEAKDALNGTTVVHTIALLNGAKILRVHDVKAAKEAIKIVEFMETRH